MKDPTPKRKRGAPRGNANALKHGFYSRKFKPADLAGLEEIKDFDLAEEIDLMRVAILRVVTQSSGITNLSESLETLQALSTAATALTRLVRVQKLLHSNDLSDILNHALEKVTHEMGIKPY